MLNLNELNAIEVFDGKISRARISNEKKNKYYYQQNRIHDLGINTPDNLRGMQILLGWCKIAVDVLDERINFRGFYNPVIGNEELQGSAEWLNSIYRDNNFTSEQKLAQKDALITGTGFISVAPGNTNNGEPELLWIAENSSTITINYSRRNREVLSGFKIIDNSFQKERSGILWLPNSTIEVEEFKGKWVEVNRDDHESGVVGIVPIFNNSDSKYIFGRSEISRSLRDLTDAGMRTLLNAEINREYYARPYRYMTGLDLTDVSIIEEKGIKAIKSRAGEITNLPFNDQNNIVPEIKELSANNPNAVMEMIETIARLVAREIGVPPSYLGFDSVNPSSADAINASEAALTRRADSRVAQLKRTYKNLAKVSLAVSGKDKPEGFNNIDAIFDRTETLSPSAASDRASKLSAIGLYDKVLPEFVYRELGFSDAEIVELKAYLNNKQNTNIINQLAEEDSGE